MVSCLEAIGFSYALLYVSDSDRPDRFGSSTLLYNLKKFTFMTIMSGLGGLAQEVSGTAHGFIHSTSFNQNVQYVT
jgi:hypothetical protein